jgi:chemotaxis protein MotA
MDMITLLGLLVGVGGILLGNLIEGGSIGSLMQATAALIVFGGTFGAVLVSSTREDLRLGFHLFRLAFRDNKPAVLQGLANEVMAAAQLARKETILALERTLGSFSDDFTRRVFRMIIDGIDPHTLRDIFELEIEVEHERLLAATKIWQDAGGFAPTIGIIGAVLGLISVMSHLTNTSELGKGIGVAFVATVYGVGSANLIFLPIANKIKRRVKQQIAARYMVLEGALAIASGLNPYVVEEKLNSYLDLSKKAS